MSELKYLHFNNDEANRKASNRKARANRSRTVAVESLDSDDIQAFALAYLSKGSDDILFIQMNIGIAQVSLDDTYNRKLGREVSSSLTRLVKFEIVGITASEDHIFLKLAEYHGINLAVRLNRKTGFSTVVGKINEQTNKA